MACPIASGAAPGRAASAAPPSSPRRVRGRRRDSERSALAAMGTRAPPRRRRGERHPQHHLQSLAACAGGATRGACLRHIEVIAQFSDAASGPAGAAWRLGQSVPGMRRRVHHVVSFAPGAPVASQGQPRTDRQIAGIRAPEGLHEGATTARADHARYRHRVARKLRGWTGRAPAWPQRRSTTKSSESSCSLSRPPPLSGPPSPSYQACGGGPCQGSAYTSRLHRGSGHTCPWPCTGAPPLGHVRAEAVPRCRAAAAG